MILSYWISNQLIYKELELVNNPNRWGGVTVTVFV